MEVEKDPKYRKKKSDGGVWPGCGVTRYRRRVERPPVEAENADEAIGEAHAQRRGPKRRRSNSQKNGPTLSHARRR